ARRLPRSHGPVPRIGPRSWRRSRCCSSAPRWCCRTPRRSRSCPSLGPPAAPRHSSAPSASPPARSLARSSARCSTARRGPWRAPRRSPASACSASSGCFVMDRVDVVIVGAGVVGLAIARELALTGREVIILDAEDAIGTHTSSRNSEVIHAGIYYPKGSLKARTCVEGKHLLYAYCAEHGVPHKQCGKLIVATEERQLTEL